MTTTRRAGLMLLAAIASIPLFAPRTAQAQVRVDNSRALDANPRIGSGGYNTGAIPPASALTGNDIVTGNVTGGREFHGNVPYTNEHEFRGNAAGSGFDRFTAGSAGTPQAYQPAAIPWEAKPFYSGASLASPPPAGYTQQGFTGVYTPSALPQQRPFEPNRMGVPDLNSPAPGDLILTGPLDAQTNLPTYLTASPLFGLRALRPDDNFLNSYSSLRADSALARLHLDPAQIQQMREELARTSDAPDATGNNGGNGNLAKPVPPPFQSPENPSLSGQALDHQLKVAPTDRVGRPAPGMEMHLLAPPSKQSTQQAELERRLNRYYVKRLATDEDKYREFLKQLRAREAATNAAPSKAPAGGEAPPVVPDLGVPEYSKMSHELITQGRQPREVKPSNPDQMRNASVPPPVQIQSLASGIKAPGLAKLLTAAEDLMKAGKYISAIDQYEAAQQVAPNNAMVLLGQGHAELGAAYYKKAEMHLRQALTADPALLMAQFDVKSMIGQERLETLVKDLKDTAKKQETDPGPVMLLAYLAYNTSSERQAGTYLALADQRSGGRDEFIKLLQTHWQLPTDLSDPTKALGEPATPGNP